MKNFFEKFGREQKFNIFIGDFLNKLSGYPSKSDISEAILSELNQSAKRYVRDFNSFSDIVQAYLDAVIDSKKNLVKQIRENFEHRYSIDTDIYKDIIDSKHFEAIFTNNFDTVIDTNFSEYVTPQRPTDIKTLEEGKIPFYKFLGDFSSTANVFLSSQDIRKLKSLDFYSKFFDMISAEFSKRPTLFIGVDLEDSDLTNILSFILDRTSDYKPIFMVSQTSIISNKSAEFISRYNIKLITGTTRNFTSYFKEISSQDKKIKLEKKFVW